MYVPAGVSGRETYFLGTVILREKPHLTKNGTAVSSADASSHRQLQLQECIIVNAMHSCTHARVNVGVRESESASAQNVRPNQPYKCVHE